MSRTIKLSHYSQEPLTLADVRAWAPHKVEQRPFKPTGLWLSVDGPDDWAAWCQENDFRLKDYRFRQEVTLAGKPHVLTLDDIKSTEVFNLAYGMPLYPGSKPLYPGGVCGGGIDWLRVQADWHGIIIIIIIIAPYHWSLRLHGDFMWYYTFDCACACIWDTSVIESVGTPEPVEWKERSYSDE